MAHKSHRAARGRRQQYYTPGNTFDAADNITLDHITYDSSIELLVTDVGLEVTLASLHLGKQIILGSSGDGVFFENVSTKINFYPMWGGVLQQEVIANQGPSGLIAPFARTYSSDMITLSLGGPEKVPLEYTSDAFEGFTLPFNASTYGVTVRPESDLPTGHYVIFRTFDGGFDGRVIYEERQKTTEIIKGGELVDFWFERPSESPANVILSSQIYTRDENYENEVEWRISANEAEGVSWAETKFRIFTDVDLAFKKDLDEQVVDNLGMITADNNGNIMTFGG